MGSNLLYEGKAKKLFYTDNPKLLKVFFKDNLTAFNGKKNNKIIGKGKLNNLISTYFFKYLNKEGIENHFIKKISNNEQLVKKLKIIPIEVVLRNTAAGSLSKRIGLKEGENLNSTILEFYLKSDKLGDPLINEDHIMIMKIIKKNHVRELKKIGLLINNKLKILLENINIKLIDLKLEFGFDSDGKILLGDEISPDTCRFWDIKTNNKLDKDRFRLNLGKVIESYKEVYARLLNKKL